MFVYLTEAFMRSDRSQGPASAPPVELLDMIMELQGRGTLASCMAVSKYWNAVAIKHLWKELASPVPLLELLAPLHRSLMPPEGCSWSIQAHEIACADWPRFSLHARHVRSLTYNEDKPLKGIGKSFIQSASFAMVASYAFISRASWPLLPNIRSLAWISHSTLHHSTPPPIVLFLSPTISNLRLHVEFPEDYYLGQADMAGLWSSLSIVAPNLRTFALELDSPDSAGWDVALGDWIQTCKQLEAVALPHGWHGDIVDALASLPQLQTIAANQRYNWDAQSRPISFISRWAQNMEAFPKLSKVGFDSNPGELVQALKPSKRSASLTSLDLRVVAESTDSLQNMMKELARCCPSLSEFNVAFDLDAAARRSQIPFETLRPLLSCSRLARFTIIAPRTIGLLPPDARDMGRAWPLLTFLNVCGIVQRMDDIVTPFESLAIFAQAFPHLNYIHLTFDPNSNLPPTTSTSFKALKVLEVGKSQAPTQALDAAFFLGSLCSSELKLRWDDLKDEEERPRVEGWRYVNEVFRRAVCMKDTVAARRGAS